jgi:hypothetical protein
MIDSQMFSTLRRGFMYESVKFDWLSSLGTMSLSLASTPVTDRSRASRPFPESSRPRRIAIPRVGDPPLRLDARSAFGDWHRIV